MFIGCFIWLRHRRVRRRSKSEIPPVSRHPQDTAHILRIDYPFAFFSFLLFSRLVHAHTSSAVMLQETQCRFLSWFSGGKRAADDASVDSFPCEIVFGWISWSFHPSEVKFMRNQKIWYSEYTSGFRCSKSTHQFGLLRISSLTVCWKCFHCKQLFIYW